MHIYIDESGSFTRRSSGEESVSAVGALVIRDTQVAGFEKLYARLRRELPKEKGEVKGRLLDEKQIEKVCQLIRTIGGIFEVVSTDLSVQTDGEIDLHQSIQAEKLTENLTDEFPEDSRERIWHLRRTLEALPRQLYLQSVATSELIHQTLNRADLFLVQRWPSELGRYVWTIDAKSDTGITNWEQWWLDTLLPILEAKTIRRPFQRVKEFNYSAQDRFKARMSDYKALAYGVSPEAEFVDMDLVLRENMNFSPDPIFGLEVVDILTNAVRRAMMANLSREGWLPIRPLMLHRNPHYIEIVTLSSREIDATKLQYASVIRDFTSGGRPMIAHRD
ncbi:hypothetical protein D1224_02240 [Henriciella barbarensis]|uniref:DUF3800 domain-containing protein n=1 Tax=Henriciella barbarensis TaxID=86342 RepID=A0A399R3T8_9PROT|nr:hypothetical protein [Henriciella barbarensis]RIJ25958.1 hypothetical protein D1224_02240 [Henriciella barbarensis]